MFNGVWDALSDGRVELAIGATQAIPTGGVTLFSGYGDPELELRGSDHPLASMHGPLSDDTLRNWPSLVGKTLRGALPKRITGCWITKKGRRITGLGVIGNLPVGGICVNELPTHFARQWWSSGKWV